MKSGGQNHFSPLSSKSGGAFTLPALQLVSPPPSRGRGRGLIAVHTFADRFTCASHNHDMELGWDQLTHLNVGWVRHIHQRPVTLVVAPLDGRTDRSGVYQYRALLASAC